MDRRFVSFVPAPFIGSSGGGIAQTVHPSAVGQVVVTLTGGVTVGFNLLCFQRCIVMRLFYFSYKKVKHDFSLLRAYAIICGRFNITVN